MCAFIAQLLISPLADRSPYIGGVLALSLLLSLLAGASYMANRTIVRRVVLPIAGVWFCARLVEALGDSRHAYTHLAPFTGLVFSCSILWALMDRFDSISKVTSSVISEAFISYMIIAIAFSQLYWVLDHFLDHPFNVVIPLGQSSTYLYYSMVTLTGLAYGAIVPINPYVRLIAALENMVGIFYIAVVVARLVSSYRARAKN
jgi:Ion channel